MSKQDPIPDDVWAAACAAWDDTVFTGREMVARAILNERERCLEVCDAEIVLARSFGAHHIPFISIIRRAIAEPAS